jgi:hypothetical protein
LSWCVSAKLAFSLGRDPDIWLLSVLVFVYYWLWQVGSSCVLLWKLSGKILSDLFWFSICHTILIEDEDGIGVVGMLVPGHCLLLGKHAAKWQIQNGRGVGYGKYDHQCDADLCRNRQLQRKQVVKLRTWSVRHRQVATFRCKIIVNCILTSFPPCKVQSNFFLALRHEN